MTEKGKQEIGSYDFFWPKLYSGRLIRRYQRFKADVLLDNGEMVTAHCPNPGRMTSCAEQGRQVYLSLSRRATRKLPYTWEMIIMPTSPVVINTMVANHLVKKAILDQKIPALAGYDSLRSEVSYGRSSRIDILLEKEDEKCLLEIKSCTLVNGRTALFPDAPTVRGRKHLRELASSLDRTTRSVIFYLIQRMDADTFVPACSIDPDYCLELERAVKKGVEVMAYNVYINKKGVALNRDVPCLVP